MDNDDNKNNNNKTSGKRSLDFNNLKRPKPTTRSSTRSTRSTRSSTSMNIEINKQNNLKDTEANHQTISDASQIETPKKTKIARLDLFRDRDIDEIIIGTNKTTKGSSQAINESSTISSYIPSVVISPPSFSPPSSIKTTISDKAASGGKAASDKAASGGKAASDKAASGGKAASDKAASGGKAASDKAASGGKAASGKAASGVNVKAVISKESPSNNNVTTSSSKVTDQVSSGEFAKLIQINQKTASKLNTIINNQERFEAMLNEQKDQISNIMSVLDSHRNVETEVEVKKKGKTKKKDKNSDEFYHDAIKDLSYELFHEHRRVTDRQMKNRLKEKLENDETSAKILMKLSGKGVSFDYLWDDRMHSQLLAANRVKKGYYIRKLKESLWSTFGINRIMPFKDNFSKQQMRTWKASKNVQQVHEDLYKPSDSDDPSSDTYISLIIKSVFASDKERTNENAIWVQSVLEVIFDEEHLSSKIDADIVNSWTGNITDTDVDSEECECESSPKTPITPIDDDDEIIGVDNRVDDVYDEHTTDDNQAADLEVADLEEEQ
ncbi:uncharacterized protein OCT59_004070 [Rhizophagus irregularis]|uniref:uncharacterized protein n=1 Tax=Rhizophagus irregularis TaxID=588596 RepID=UPI00332A0CF6|nr:hypothetical protein OCT59_004070 [Rhizophagus irregularis]